MSYVFPEFSKLFSNFLEFLTKKILKKVKPNFLFVDIYSEDLKKREDKKCLMMR